MPLYEYECKECHTKFEQITSYSKRKDTACPKCSSKKINLLTPLFQVKGRGDLRESTMHGCHTAQPSLGEGGAGGERDHAGHDHASHDHTHEHTHGNWVHDALMGKNPEPTAPAQVPEKTKATPKKHKGRAKHRKN